MSGSNQNVETSCKDKLKLAKLKDLCFKARWMYITAILKLKNFSGRDIISDNEFLLSILDAFTVGHEIFTQSITGKWCKKPSDILS